LVGATPWRQQVALVLGVIFGALVIPPILGVLNTTFGFQGAPGAGPQALAAPQAALISAIAQGVLGGSLDWNLILLGAGIGAAAIAADELLRGTGRGSLPPLAVGMGLYLPMGLTILIPIGALIGHRARPGARRAAGGAGGDRTDRGRKPVWSGVRGHRGGQRQPDPPGAGKGKWMGRAAGHSGVCRRDCVALPHHSQSRHSRRSVVIVGHDPHTA
jgi:hypothetical protein